MNIETSHEVVEARKWGERKVITAENLVIGDIVEVEVDEILIAASRAPNLDIIRPEKTDTKQTRRAG